MFSCQPQFKFKGHLCTSTCKWITLACSTRQILSCEGLQLSKVGARTAWWSQRHFLSKLLQQHERRCRKNTCSTANRWKSRGKIRSSSILIEQNQCVYNQETSYTIRNIVEATRSLINNIGECFWNASFCLAFKRYCASTGYCAFIFHSIKTISCFIFP